MPTEAHDKGLVFFSQSFLLEEQKEKTERQLLISNMDSCIAYVYR